MKSKLAITLAVLGALLFLLSFAWGFLFPVEKLWTAEKSELVDQLSTQVQKLHMQVTLGDRNPAKYGDRDPGVVKQEYEATKEKLAALKAEFERAKDSPASTANGLRWTGMLCGLVGLVMLRTVNG